LQHRSYFLGFFTSEPLSDRGAGQGGWRQRSEGGWEEEEEEEAIS